jgi:hydroxymethylglutaryl-CoA reductase (NADPH)
VNRATIAVNERRLREEIIQRLVRREIGFHRLPADLPPAEAAAIRREALERITGVELRHLAEHDPEAASAVVGNVENFIGMAQVPVGVVGPLTLHGAEGESEVYVPLATTEAALVASTNRGCSALRAAGGAVVSVEDAGMTRAPVFRTDGVRQTRTFLDWIAAHEPEIRERAEASSRYLKLMDIRPMAFGTTVLLRFRFATGDAMGMNIVTIATDRVVNDFIEPGTGVECIALSGNYCVDKKPSAINFQEGRGKRIFAEAVLQPDVLARSLKTDADSLVEVQYRKNLLGSIAAGSQGGFNAHYANLVAAFFLATGQDLAHVVGGSMGITCIEKRADGAAYVSIYMPDVPLGVIGGGTRLGTQSESLAILGVEADPARPGRAVKRLGEILGAVVLAGEVSLMSAFTSRDLAGAHDRLRRGGDLTAAVPADR